MPQLNLNIPEDVYAELTNVATQLKQTPEQCAALAVHHFFQTASVENAIEGVARLDDEEILVDFPELKEELGIDIKFHPMAMEELETLEEEDQVEILGELIDRVSQEESAENTIDLVLMEKPTQQVLLSGFTFGDVVYSVGDTIAIYHIALMDEEVDEDEEDDDVEEDDLEIEDAHEECISKSEN